MAVNKILRSNHLDEIDVNDPDFYNILQDEIDSDLARIKKSVEIVRNLRLTAAEMAIETAALYHAELWRDIEDFKSAIRDKFEVNNSQGSTVQCTPN